jgi:hypothetical protein
VLGEGVGQALWIDRDGDRPIRLEAKVSGASPLGLTIHFSDFRPVAAKGADAANPRLPHVIAYEVNGRLFRRTAVTDVQSDAPARSFPVERWRQQLGLAAAPSAYALTPAEGARP